MPILLSTFAFKMNQKYAEDHLDGESIQSNLASPHRLHIFNNNISLSPHTTSNTVKP